MGRHLEVPLTVKVAGADRDEMLDLTQKFSSAIFKVPLPEGIRIDSVGLGYIAETMGVDDMICPRCGREFTCEQGHTEPHLCRGCHDAEIQAETEAERFNFLKALDERGIEHQVWNTGGYVMCHAIPVTKNAEGEYEAYILFSEKGVLDEKIGFCYYPPEIEVGQILVKDDGTQIGNVCWFNDQIEDNDEPETVAKIMDWFVPMYEQLKAGTIPAGGSEV